MVLERDLFKLPRMWKSLYLVQIKKNRLYNKEQYIQIATFFAPINISNANFIYG